MAEKKGFFANLFSGGCNCGMSIEEENAAGKKAAKKKGGYCDLQIVEETDNKSATDNTRRYCDENYQRS